MKRRFVIVMGCIDPSWSGADLALSNSCLRTYLCEWDFSFWYLGCFFVVFLAGLLFMIDGLRTPYSHVVGADESMTGMTADLFLRYTLVFWFVGDRR
jgi:hypothetical protein